jgi:thymidylate kinase
MGVEAVGAIPVPDLETRRPVRVIELVGPAGAGKTTLMRALRRRNPRLGEGVRVSKIQLIPFFVDNTRLLLPTYLRHHRGTRWLTWRETRAMMYVNAWHHYLTRREHDRDAVTLLDHGPVFRLTRLREFGPQLTRSEVFESWWQAALNQWAIRLEAIVWLDATDEILVERIRSRAAWHRVKRGREADIRRFLTRYRACYEQVLSRLTAIRPPRVLRFDTGLGSADEIAEAVLAALDLRPGGD